MDRRRRHRHAVALVGRLLPAHELRDADRALKDAADQLRPHVDPLVAKLRSAGHRGDDALELFSGVLDFLGMVSPGGAIEGGGKLLNFWRRKRSDQRKTAVLGQDRRISGHDDSYDEAVRLAESLSAVSRAGIPIVVAVDDAHWADPGLVCLMRNVAQLEDSRILIVTTAWPEQLRVREHDVSTFAGWIASTSATLGDRFTRRKLDPLTTDDLGEMIRRRAIKTEFPKVEAIAKIASGNPLTLSLLLDLDKIKRDIEADGAIDTDPAELQRLPQDLRTIYQSLWSQLPDATQQVLAIASLQGQEFLPGAVLDGATAIGIYASAHEALNEADDVHGWTRPVSAFRHEFVERQRHEVAADNFAETFDSDAQDRLRRAVVDHTVEFQASAEWTNLDLRTGSSRSRTASSSRLRSESRHLRTCCRSSSSWRRSSSTSGSTSAPPAWQVPSSQLWPRPTAMWSSSIRRGGCRAGH